MKIRRWRDQRTALLSDWCTTTHQRRAHSALHALLPERCRPCTAGCSRGAVRALLPQQCACCTAARPPGARAALLRQRCVGCTRYALDACTSSALQTIVRHQLRSRRPPPDARGARPRPHLIYNLYNMNTSMNSRSRSGSSRLRPPSRSARREAWRHQPRQCSSWMVSAVALHKRRTKAAQKEADRARRADQATPERHSRSHHTSLSARVPAAAVQLPRCQLPPLAVRGAEARVLARLNRLSPASPCAWPHSLSLRLLVRLASSCSLRMATHFLIQT
eukprot:COSAG03_NODE_1058_length_4933_cov_40.252586_2_plen_277_part_00